MGVSARVVRARASGGCARDAVDERTGVAMDEDSAGEDGVAAAATPSPKSARGTRAAKGGASSLSAFDGAAAVGAVGLPRPTKTRPSSPLAARAGCLGATMDVIGLSDLAGGAGAGFGIEAAFL